MKEVVFIGNSIGSIRDFPEVAKRETGYQLDRVQRGLDPVDWKPMTSVGQGVKEIRIKHEGQYRVIYIAKFNDAIYVLHAFQKKTQKTSKQDIDTEKRALNTLQEMETA